MLDNLIDEIKGLFEDTSMLIILLMCLFFLYMGGNAIFQNVWGNYSQSVAGVVTRSEAVYRNSSGSRPGQFRYYFEYEYVYQDQKYTSDRYTFKSGGNSSAVDALNEGDEVVVYLNPNRPENSIVERGISWLNYVWVGFGLLIGGRVIQLNHQHVKRSRLN